MSANVHNCAYLGNAKRREECAHLHTCARAARDAAQSRAALARFGTPYLQGDVHGLLRHVVKDDAQESALCGNGRLVEGERELPVAFDCFTKSLDIRAEKVSVAVESRGSSSIQISTADGGRNRLALTI